MNDFERKLSRQPFRDLPPDLKAQVLRQSAPADSEVEARWSDWLWPSPKAWGALAALWLVLAVIARLQFPAETNPPVAAHPEPVAGGTLFAFQARDYARVLDLPN